MSSSPPIIHSGFKDFSLGSFDNGGDNLYVNSRGEIEIIHRFDVNGDGHVDILIADLPGRVTVALADPQKPMSFQAEKALLGKDKKQLDFGNW